MARQLIIPFLITANYQTSLAIRQLRGELGQLPTELTALRAAAAEVYAIGAMGLFSFGMLAVGAQQLASALLAAQRMAALAAVASGQFAAASAVANQILRESASIVRGTGVDLQSVSAAFLEAARAGLTLQESVSLLPQALRLAVTSGGDVAEVFRMTFAIMRNMGIPITEETAKTLTSQLSYALDQSLMDIEDVMHAIKYVGPIAGQLRIPLHDLFAALMMLHDAGIRASIAGTGLARLLIRLQAPTMQARRQLAALGVDWRELQPIGRNLADVFDLLITRADATTIRLLLGERAERAFYAIIQQGTERLRQYSEELRAVGENAEYLELKFKALLKTPAFRFQAALQDIRTAGSMLIEPFVKLQLTVLESISAALKAIADSPALRAITKLAIGFGSLVGTAALLASTLSWIIGRFLELGTIGTHFLLVLDRLQAGLKSLTLSALFTPIRGLWLGLRTLLTGGGTERLASLVAERLRISELASAIAQPLIFFRRARRIHPLLQPLPEYFALEFGSAAAAAAQLGIPIEQFLLAGLTYGGMRATIPTFRKLDWTEILASYYTAFLENVLMNFEDTLLRSVARTGKVFIRPPTLPKGELTRRIINAISDIQAKNFTEWLIAVQQKIFEGIAVQESIIRAAELTTLGYAGTDLVERQRAASAFAEQLDRLIAANIRQFKTALATGLAAIPEIQVITRVSREAQEAVDRFLNQILLYLPVESLQPALESFYRSIQGIANNLNKQAQPFLKEYQRKVQAVLRSANIDEFVRSLLLGAIALPTDALTEASYLAIGATTGLMAGKVPIEARQFDRYITDLAKEFSSFMQGVDDITSAAVWLGLSFGASLRKTPPTSVIESLITARTRTISTLKQLKFLGLASAEQLAALTSAQSELGLLIGMLFSQRLRRLQPQLMTSLFSNRLSLDRVTAFYNMIRSIGSGQFKALQEALLSLGLDLPEVIGRLTREGAPFYQLVAKELSMMPDAAALQQLWMRFSYNVLRAQKAVRMAFTPELTRNLIQSLRAYGLSEKQAAELLSVMQAGILSVIAERAAAGRELTGITHRAADIRTRVRRLAAIGTFFRDFVVAFDFAFQLLMRTLLAPLKLPRLVLTGGMFVGRMLFRAIFTVISTVLGFLWKQLFTGMVALFVARPQLAVNLANITARIAALTAPIRNYTAAVMRLLDQIDRGVYSLANLPRRYPFSVRFAVTVLHRIRQFFRWSIRTIGPWIVAMWDAAAEIYSQITNFLASLRPSELIRALKSLPFEIIATLGRGLGAPLDAAAMELQLGRWLRGFGVRVRRWWLRMLRDTFFGREVVKPIVSALSMLPQFMLGKDIAQAIKPAGLLGKVVKGFGIASIVSLIASFILDMIPWDEIARVFNLSTKTKVYLRNLGPGIRTLLWSVLISVSGLLKVITVDFALGLMDIFRGGQGFLARARNTFSSLAEAISNLFVQFMTEVNNQLQMAYAESQIAFTELTTNLVSFSKSLTAGLKSLTQQEQMLYRSLNEAWSILTSSASEIQTAPIGYESQWREIGRSAVIYADALVNVSEAFRQLQMISLQRSIFQQTFTGIAEAANNVVSNVKLLQQLGVDAWKASSEEFQTRIESLRTSLVGISGLTAKFRTLRNEINKLPPEQRILLAETLAYIDKILSYEQALNTAIDNASKVPEKYREKLMQTLSEFAGLLSADQLRASVFDPIREQLEDLQERTNETIKVLKELRDPFVRRELALDIARQQWEVLTAQHRQMSEVLSAWAELETELRGTTSELMVSAAQSIAAAWNEVLDALQRQRVQSIEEALQLLSSAFELVGDESKEAITKIAELERLLRQFNFMMLTPEAEREIKKRVAELGRDVLEAFRKIRQALQDEMDEWKQLLDEYADTFAAMTSDVVDRAIAAERRYLNWALIEADRRAEIMRKLGYSEEQIQEANLRFMSRIATRLYFFRQPTLEQIQQFHSQLAELAESSEDFATAFANRQAAATTSMYRYYRFLELATQVVQRVGVRTRAFYDYITKAYQSLREAMEMSLDIKVLFFGLHVAWSQVSEVFSSFGESLEDLASKVSMFSLVFNVGVAKIQNLFGQMQKLAVGGIGAFVQRMRIWRQIREIWRTLFPEPSEVADSLRQYSEMLERVVEEGYVPGFLGMTMPQVRQAFMQVLVWLRNFYMQQLQAIAGLMSQVPQWSRVWLELFNAQMRVADALMEIENRLRNIRAEFLSLELFAVPERIGQFLVTQGPALFTFMRTGALGGQSTIQFTIYVNAQDVSAGVQQALAEAQRRLMGFNLQPLF